MAKKCDIKCPLKFLTLWIIHCGEKTGATIARELAKRRGSKPSPGTIYPVLKELKDCDLISQEKGYELTARGKKELHSESKMVARILYDFDKIKKHAGKKS